jgi:hypothetical protein
MYTTIIKTVVVALALSTTTASAQDIKPACEGLGAVSQQFAEMRDIGMEMTDAMNYFIELADVQKDESLQWVYTLALIAYENPTEAPTDIGYAVFVSCMEMAGEVG